MSYCRFSRTSDVYVFLNTRDRLECCGCQLPGSPMFAEFATVEDMVAHLGEHTAHGHKVPADVPDALRVDLSDWEGK